MIDVKVSGKKATVTRSFDFPKITPVDGFPLKVDYEFDIPMAGLDPKSPSAKRILSGFAKSYKKAVQTKEKSRNSENEKIWQLAAKEIEGGKDPKKVEKDTQVRLQKRWGDFHDKVLDPAIYDVVCDLADEDLKANKIPRAKASSYKDYFSGITLGAGLLGVGKATTAAGTAAVAGTAGAILPALVAVGAIVASLAAARKVSERIYRDMNTIYKKVDKTLDAVNSTVSGLDSQLETMEKYKEATSAQMIKSHAQIKQLRGEFKRISQIAKKENIHKERLSMIEKQIDAAQEALKSGMLARKKIVGDIAIVRDLGKKAEAAAKNFKADRSAYDNMLASSEDFFSAIGTLDTVTGAMKKDEEKKAK